MEQLSNSIETYKEELSESNKILVSEKVLSDNSKYPFNKYANIFSVLLTKGSLTYDEYVLLREEYFRRNPNLDKFEMAPRTFGQTWGEDWLKKEKDGILIDPPGTRLHSRLRVLYAKYNLSEEEIAFIEKMIKPME